MNRTQSSFENSAHSRDRKLRGYLTWLRQSYSYVFVMREKHCCEFSQKKKKRKNSSFPNKEVKRCSHHLWSVPCSEADGMSGKRTEKAAWCDQTDTPQSPMCDNSFLGLSGEKKDTLCCLTPLEHASVTDVRTCWLENVLEVGAYSAFIGSFALMWFSCLCSFSGFSTMRGQLCSDGRERCHSCPRYPFFERFSPSATAIILWGWVRTGLQGKKRTA